MERNWTRTWAQYFVLCPAATRQVAMDNEGWKEATFSGARPNGEIEKEKDGELEQRDGLYNGNAKGSIVLYTVGALILLFYTGYYALPSLYGDPSILKIRSQNFGDKIYGKWQSQEQCKYPYPEHYVRENFFCDGSVLNQHWSNGWRPHGTTTKSLRYLVGPPLPYLVPHARLYLAKLIALANLTSSVLVLPRFKVTEFQRFNTCHLPICTYFDIDALGSSVKWVTQEFFEKDVLPKLESYGTFGRILATDHRHESCESVQSFLNSSWFYPSSTLLAEVPILNCTGLLLPALEPLLLYGAAEADKSSILLASIDIRRNGLSGNLLRRASPVQFNPRLHKKVKEFQEKKLGPKYLAVLWPLDGWRLANLTKETLRKCQTKWILSIRHNLRKNNLTTVFLAPYLGSLPEFDFGLHSSSRPFSKSYKLSREPVQGIRKEFGAISWEDFDKTVLQLDLGTQYILSNITCASVPTFVCDPTCCGEISLATCGNNQTPSNQSLFQEKSSFFPIKTKAFCQDGSNCYECIAGDLCSFQFYFLPSPYVNLHPFMQEFMVTLDGPTRVPVRVSYLGRSHIEATYFYKGEYRVWEEGRYVFNVRCDCMTGVHHNFADKVIASWNISVTSRPSVVEENPISPCQVGQWGRWVRLSQQPFKESVKEWSYVPFPCVKSDSPLFNISSLVKKLVKKKVKKISFVGDSMSRALMIHLGFLLKGPSKYRRFASNTWKITGPRSTRGFTLHNAFVDGIYEDGEFGCINRGHLSGNKLIPAYPPDSDIVVLGAGTWTGKYCASPVEAYKKYLPLFLHKMRTLPHKKSAKFYFRSTPPYPSVHGNCNIQNSVVRALNEYARDAVREYNITFMDLYAIESPLYRDNCMKEEEVGVWRADKVHYSCIAGGLTEMVGYIGEAVIRTFAHIISS